MAKLISTRPFVIVSEENVILKKNKEKGFGKHTVFE